MNLLLQEPQGLEAADPVAIERQQRLLEQVLQPVQRALLDNTVNRKESRVWLMTSLSQLPAPQDQAKRFAFLLSASALREEGTAGPCASLQLIQLLLQHSPQEAVSIFLEQPAIFKDYFYGHEARTRQWFSHFRMSKLSDFGYGGKALASYALKHRDDMWDLLEWEGKHPQAPVAVAARPHYFSQLNISRTVDNLVDDCPGFWTSEEFRGSMVSGELLTSEAEHFSKDLHGMLLAGGRRSEDIRRLLLHFMEQQPFQRLCQGLLPHFSDAELTVFAQHLLPAATADSATGGYRSIMQQLVFGSIRWESLDELLLHNALALHARALKQMLSEDDRADALQEVLHAIAKLHAGIESAQQEWALREASAKGSANAALKLLVLKGWILATDIAECIKGGPAEVTAMLQLNGLGSVQSQPPPEAEQKDQQGKKRKAQKDRKKHKRKHKKRRSSYSDSGSDDLGEGLVAVEQRVVELSFAEGEKFLCSLATLQAPLYDHVFKTWTRWLIEKLDSA